MCVDVDGSVMSRRFDGRSRSCCNSIDCLVVIILVGADTMRVVRPRRSNLSEREIVGVGFLEGARDSKSLMENERRGRGSSMMVSAPGLLRLEGASEIGEFSRASNPAGVIGRLLLPNMRLSAS